MVRRGSIYAYAEPAAMLAVATTRRTATPRSIFTIRAIRSSKAMTHPKAGDGVTWTRLCSTSAIAPRRTTVLSLATIKSAVHLPRPRLFLGKGLARAHRAYDEKRGIWDQSRGDGAGGIGSAMSAIRNPSGVLILQDHQERR